MNKTNIGILVASSTLIVGAIAGGSASIAIAQNRSNAYAPTTIQKQRSSLLDTFFNEEHYTGGTGTFGDGNPFEMLAKANLTKIIEKVLKLDSKNKNMFSDVADASKFKLVNKMSFLRLDKGHDALLIILNDKNGHAIMNASIKIDLDIKYNDEDTFNKWGSVLEPQNVLDSGTSSEGIYVLPKTVIEKVGTDMQDAIKNKRPDDYLKSLQQLKDWKPNIVSTADAKLSKENLFAKVLIDSLILWKVYNCSEDEMKNIDNTEKLKDFIKRFPNQKETVEDINEAFMPFKNTMKFFPSSITFSRAEIISSDMDIIDSMDITDPEIKDNFENFEMSTMLGLILYPDAFMSNNKLEVISKVHRDYNALSDAHDSSEPGVEVRSPFQDAIDNYKYFIKGDK